MPEMLTAREAADLLRVSPQTIASYIKQQKLPAVKVGRSWLIRRAEVERILAGPPGAEQSPPAE
jgi:excisionase family DNA binding protein